MNNVGSFQNNLDKRLRKLHMTIDSSQRDKKIYPDPNNYTINLDNNNRLRNVNSIRLIESMLPNSQYIINKNNKYIDYIDSTGQITTIELTEGDYSEGSLKTLLEKESIISNADFDVHTRKLTITTTDTVTFLFETGNNANCSPIDVLGANKDDILIDKTYTFPNNFNLEHSKFVDLGIEEIPDITNKLMIEKDINKFLFKRIPIKSGTDTKYDYYKSLEQLPYNYFTPMEFSKFTIVLYDDKGNIYDSGGKNNYFIFEMTLLEDTSPENVSFFPPDPKPEIEINKTDIEIEKETKINYFDLDSKDVKENFENQENIKNQEDLSTKIEEIDNKETHISNEPESQTPINDLINTDNNINEIDVKENNTTIEKNKDVIKMIEEYINKNKLTVIGIGLFLIIFLMIFSRRK